ncbi:hypothetical protein L3Q82_001040 [Scortum barcoo]|uniref:Uncharacterized protein n=1 Tax=Scortum barcoo TaxID=214431 RepID=A0ACB8WAZ8_9TELE|nr:hypothetical protein L3Q82_001040 [Scortum barcoo]
MDTIFVKSVKENGPAQQAGLCTGDRLVKVNGESILGKTYSQVIALIQNSEDILELSIMPKDEDVLQLVYSQDAYLKGNYPYSSEAHTLPGPPPLCYPSTKHNSSAPQPSCNLHSPLKNWQRRPSSTTSPLNNHLPAASTPTCSWPKGLENSSGQPDPSWQHPAIDVLEFHFANHNAAIASATLPPPQKSSLPGSAHTHAETLCHQALTDWYYSQTEAAERMHPHHSISHDCLAKPGQGSAVRPGPTSTSISSPKQCRRKALLYHHHLAAASHDCSSPGGWGGVSGPGSRSCSESLLAAYAEYEHNYGRSVETLARAAALVSPSYEHSSQGSQITNSSKQKDQKFFIPASSTVSPSGRQSGQQVAEPQTRRIKEEELIGYKSYSPSLSYRSGHLLQQANFSGPYLKRCPTSRGSPAESKGGMVPRPQSTPTLSASEDERAQLSEDREVISHISVNEEVVLREKSASGRQTPVQVPRHPHYTTPVESSEPSDLMPTPRTPSPVCGRPGPSHRANGSLAQHAFNSLSSIPFIGSNKGRRSSYLLAITTERSKSCEEGLNTFREEGCVLSKLPKRVKSFFTDGSLESLRAQEEARSKRHSTSELGTITFSDVRKEGWLHYKQILTEKGKKVGGGIRPWKRIFSVLRCHSLFLYKDKREAILHGAEVGPSQDEHPPISIRGCLIDIAYSETKRKHTLRLTTQDFCEYLLQAEDRDDMLAWIRVIRENSKTDNEEIGFSRQALINKKLNDYRKHSLTGNKPDFSPRAHCMMPPFLLAKTENTSLNRSSRADDNKALWGINIMKKAKKTATPKAFGVRLENCQPAVNHKFVPLIVEMCCGVVEATGLEYTGIYRVPGNNAMVSNLQDHLNKGMDINTAEEWGKDGKKGRKQKIASEKPVDKEDMENDSPATQDGEDSVYLQSDAVYRVFQQLMVLRKTPVLQIHDLPDHYYHTLKFLMGHLRRVADNSEKNKMEPRNLALVFGPTLVRTSEDNMTDMVKHMPDRYKIVETLILRHDWFFSNGQLEEEEQVLEDKWDMQPVPNIDHLLSNIGRPGMPGEASDFTTSDPLKSKLSSGSKKDLSAKDFQPVSIISAVTRKRKKCLSTHQQGSADFEHEPVKASNYAEGEGLGGEEKEDRGENAVKREHTIPKIEQRDDKGNGVRSRDITLGKD